MRFYVKASDGEIRDGQYLSRLAAERAARRANDEEPERDWHVLPVVPVVYDDIKVWANVGPVYNGMDSEAD